MALHGNIMDHLPQPLLQMLGKGEAVAMSEKFDMGAMLEKMRAEEETAIAAQMQTIPGMTPQAQSFNFAEGQQRGNNFMIQFPVNPSAMTPENQVEVKELLAQAISGYVQSSM